MTNTKEYQEALQNLTAAFFQFLRVANPEALTREADLLYVAQALKGVATHLATVDGATPAITQQPITAGPATTATTHQSMNTETPAQHVDTPPQTSAQVNGLSLPNTPNMFREMPFYDKRSGKWTFDRLKTMDGDNKLFCLYINGDYGEFEMKPVSAENWQVVYESREKILPPAVVTVDGDITPSAESKPVSRGEVHKEGGLWIVEKPCRVSVTSI